MRRIGLVCVPMALALLGFPSTAQGAGLRLALKKVVTVDEAIALTTRPGDKAVWVAQKSGKVVHAWALGGDLDATTIQSNRFTTEWPPRSGRMREFPEVDRAQWFELGEAREKINPAQAELLDRLQQLDPPGHR